MKDRRIYFIIFVYCIAALGLIVAAIAYSQEVQIIYDNGTVGTIYVEEVFIDDFLDAAEHYYGPAEMEYHSESLVPEIQIPTLDEMAPLFD